VFLHCSIVTARVENGEPAETAVDIRVTLYALSLSWLLAPQPTVRIELVPAVAQLSIDDDPRQMDPPLIIAGGGMGHRRGLIASLRWKEQDYCVDTMQQSLFCTLVSQSRPRVHNVFRESWIRREEMARR